MSIYLKYILESDLDESLVKSRTIIDDYNTNYRTLTTSQRLNKYPELERFEDKKWFKDFISEQELKYQKSQIIPNKEKRPILSIHKSENPTT